MRLFTTEQVSKYHPDKYADQISDAILDACLEQDKTSRVACECMVKFNNVILCGEITTKANINLTDIVQKVGNKLNYTVDSLQTGISEQSPEIATGVKNGKDLRAGDQGIMFGYACKDTDVLLPFGFDMANKVIKLIEDDAEKSHSILKGDAKCQVTVDLDKKPNEDSLTEILISVCHKSGVDEIGVEKYIKDILSHSDLKIGRNVKINVNPAGLWICGGPTADCGLTGRKIVCDQYGGYCRVGGGAFSGKDPSKVDRSAAYMARKIACDLVKNEELDWCEVQLAYAIGEAEPMSVNVSSPKATINNELAEKVKDMYDLTPYGIIEHLDLQNVNYEKIAEGCHYRKGIWRL